MKFPLLQGVVNTVATTPTTWNNGLPLDSTGALCISTNAIQTWENGIPFDSAGAVVVNNSGGINKWPVFSLDFSTGVLDSRVTFTRASGATYTDSTGTLQLATTNTPRFDYDPVTLAIKGLLIEEQRTNLLTYSDQFDNAAWAKTGSPTITANVAIAPDGTSTADLFSRTTTAASYIAQSVSKAASALAYTASFYVKKSNCPYFAARMQGTYPSRVDAFFNLDTGTSNTPTASGSFTSADGSIKSVGNGWYRITLSAISDTATTIMSFGSFNTAGIVVDGVDSSSASSGYIWGAQLEAGSFATSYIPTTTAQATRAADVAVVTGTNFSSWYNQSEGTLYAEFDKSNITADGRLFWVDDGSSSNAIDVTANVNGYVLIEGIKTGTYSGNLQKGTYVINTSTKAVAAYSSSLNESVTISGLSPADGNLTLPSSGLIRLSIGSQLGGSSAFLNGHIKSLAYWNTRLTNTQLQTITA